MLHAKFLFLLSISFYLASGTKAVNLQFVTLYLKTVLFCDVSLKGFDPLILELDDFSASGANEVIMMSAVRRPVLIPGEAVLESPLFSDSRLRQQFQGTIDRCIPDPGKASFL